MTSSIHFRGCRELKKERKNSRELDDEESEHVERFRGCCWLMVLLLVFADDVVKVMEYAAESKGSDVLGRATKSKQSILVGWRTMLAFSTKANVDATGPEPIPILNLLPGDSKLSVRD